MTKAMPNSITIVNRFRRILRNLLRIMTRKTPLPTTFKPSTRIRTVQIGLVMILIPFLLGFGVVLYLQSRYDPESDMIPIPQTFESQEFGTQEKVKLPLRIILVVPPFTNYPLQPHASPPLNTLYNQMAFSELLVSLRDAHYEPYQPSLKIILSPPIPETCAALAGFEWPHGRSSIVNSTTTSLFDRVASAWSPERDAQDAVALIDASRAVPFSPTWYQYVMSARERYKNTPDVAAFAIEPIQPPGTSIPSPRTGEDIDVFFYPATPFLPILIPASVDVWRAFTRWFTAQRADWFLWPFVVGARSRKDVSWETFHGTGRADWTLWFSRFCALHGLYTVFPRQVNPAPLQALSAPTVAARLALNGAVVQTKGRSHIDSANVARIVSLARKHNGTVSLTVINKAFLETAHSWLCNVDTAGVRPPGVVWITTDDDAHKELKNVTGSYALRLAEMRGGGKQGTSYGTPGYWLLMLERTMLIRDILDQGVAVFAFETDQVWLHDPIPFVHRIVHSGDEVDIVGTLDTRHEIGGNFLYLNPTLATRRVWREVCRRFKQAYKQNGMARHSRRFRRYIENDQSILTKLVLFDETFKARNPVVFRSLDTELFVDGRWYDNTGKFYTSPKSRSPIMVNNNFMIGINHKKERLKRHGHWFLKDGTCDVERVNRAIHENEGRRMKAGLSTLHDDNETGQGEAGKQLNVLDLGATLSTAITAIEKELTL